MAKSTVGKAKPVNPFVSNKLVAVAKPKCGDQWLTHIHLNAKTSVSAPSLGRSVRSHP